MRFKSLDLLYIKDHKLMRVGISRTTIYELNHNPICSSHSLQIQILDLLSHIVCNESRPEIPILHEHSPLWRKHEVTPEFGTYSHIKIC